MGLRETYVDVVVVGPLEARSAIFTRGFVDAGGQLDARTFRRLSTIFGACCLQRAMY